MQKVKFVLCLIWSNIVSMRAEGVTLRETGDELGLSYKQMRDWS